MGFRTGFTITSLSFLYGVLFIASVYDFPLIYSGYTDADVDASEAFYLSFFRGPTAIGALLHGVMALGVLGLVGKLHRWSEMAKYFDGTSLVLFVGAIAMYLVVIIPNLRLLADPTNATLLNRSSIRTERDSVLTAAGKPTPDWYEEGLTSAERVSALKIIAATNTINIALLAGVVILQAAEVYMDYQEKVQANKEREKAAEELRMQLKGKKDK